MQSHIGKIINVNFHLKWVMLQYIFAAGTSSTCPTSTSSTYSFLLYVKRKAKRYVILKVYVLFCTLRIFRKVIPDKILKEYVTYTQRFTEHKGTTTLCFTLRPY